MVAATAVGERFNRWTLAVPALPIQDAVGPAVATAVHGQPVGALVIDLFNSTVAAKAIRFRWIELTGEPVRLKYFGVHKAPVFDEHGSAVFT